MLQSRARLLSVRRSASSAAFPAHRLMQVHWRGWSAGGAVSHARPKSHSELCFFPLSPPLPNAFLTITPNIRARRPFRVEAFKMRTPYGSMACRRHCHPYGSRALHEYSHGCIHIHRRKQAKAKRKRDLCFDETEADESKSKAVMRCLVALRYRLCRYAWCVLLGIRASVCWCCLWCKDQRARDSQRIAKSDTLHSMHVVAMLLQPNRQRVVLHESSAGVLPLPCASLPSSAAASRRKQLRRVYRLHIHGCGSPSNNLH